MQIVVLHGQTLAADGPSWDARLSLGTSSRRSRSDPRHHLAVAIDGDLVVGTAAVVGHDDSVGGASWRDCHRPGQPIE
jgi:hypothetical protein